MGTYIGTIRTGHKNDQISLEIYKGNLSINQTWEGSKGTLDNWIYKSEWKDGAHQPGERQPLRIRLGDPATAAKLLTQLAAMAQKEADAAKGSHQGGSPHLEAPTQSGGMTRKEVEEVFGKPYDDGIPF